MNTTTMNKDSTGGNILLGAMILGIGAALFSGMNVQAQAVNTLTTKATGAAQTKSNEILSDSLIITATRLK